MKCPQCQNNQRVRSGMQCSKCQYQFTFNPKEPKNHGMTDGKFLSTVRATSQNGEKYFTLNQLYSAFIRTKKSPVVGGLIALLIGFAIAGLFAAIVQEVFVFLFFAAFIVLGFLILLFSNPFRVTRAVFERFVQAWKNDGKSIDHLIEKPALHEPPPQWDEEDIYDYGVERILVVQRDILVDLLVLNNVHAEQNALIVSESGYPRYIADRATALLAERPDLPVFLLHDADEAGRGMKNRVRRLTFLSGARNFIDLGFYPEDFKRIKRVKNFDRYDRERALPADALLTGFLTTGLAACFVNSTAMGAMLDQYAREVDNQSASFG